MIKVKVHYFSFLIRRDSLPAVLRFIFHLRRHTQQVRYFHAHDGS